jgi:hypothetical protein
VVRVLLGQLQMQQDVLLEQALMGLVATEHWLEAK